MPHEINCFKCKASIDLEKDTVVCYTCDLGHFLCEKCTGVVNENCPLCGGKFSKIIQDDEVPKIVKELYKSTPNDWKQKLENSCSTLEFDQPFEFDGTSETSEPPTEIGFRKWPRTFFHRIPHEHDILSKDERALLRNLPLLVENEGGDSSSIKSTALSQDSQPKSYRDLEMSHEIMRCPITQCSHPICNFDATNHILLCHDNLPIEMVQRFEAAELLSFNPMASARKNEVKGLMRLLYAGIVTDLGASKHKNCLPFYLLCTRINIHEMENFLKGLKDSTGIAVAPLEYRREIVSDKDYVARNPWMKSDCILVWCAGIVPLKQRLTIALSAFPDDNSLTTFGMTMNVLPLHKRHEIHDVYISLDRLILTKNDLDHLSTGKEGFFKMRINFQ